MLHRFWKPSWLEKSSKKLTKIDPRGNRFGHWFWHPFVIEFWSKLGARTHCRDTKNIEKPIAFKVFVISAILSWCLVGFIFYWLFSIFRAKKQSKLHPKSMKDQSKNQSKSWCNFGRMFSGFWKDFGSEVGPQVGSKIDEKLN